MDRYTANKIVRMVNLAGLTFKERCSGQECPFGDATEENYRKNRALLCAYTDTDFCVTSSYFNSGRPKSYWFFYKFNYASNNIGAHFGIYEISPQFCHLLMQSNFDELGEVEVRAYAKNGVLSERLKRRAINGRISETDRKDFHEICTLAEDINGYNTIYFGFYEI